MPTLQTLPLRRIAVRGVLGAAVIGAIVVIGAGIVLRVALSPNATERLPLPDWLEAATERNGFAYPAHILFARAIDLTNGPAEASAVQYLKAVAHARSPDELARATAGLREARARATERDDLDARLCWLLEPWPTRREREALRDAGVTCSPRK